MSREEYLSPTYLAMGMRKQWSDEHMFEENDQSRGCGRCGKRRRNSDHVDRDHDKAAVMRWKDSIVEERGWPSA